MPEWNASSGNKSSSGAGQNGRWFEAPEWRTRTSLVQNNCWSTVVQDRACLWSRHLMSDILFIARVGRALIGSCPGHHRLGRAIASAEPPPRPGRQLKMIWYTWLFTTENASCQARSVPTRASEVWIETAADVDLATRDAGVEPETFVSASRAHSS